MTYETFIAKLRKEVKDLEKLSYQKFDGDGSTTQFQTTNYPIKDGSYTVKVSGVTKTDGTDYTLDLDIGLIEFATAPAAGSDNVTIEYRYYKLRDIDYIDIINDGIDYFRDNFWTEEVDTTSITSVAYQYDYDLSSLLSKTPICIINIQYQPTGSTEWTDLQSQTNVTFYKNKKCLHFNPPLSTSGLAIKLRYLAALEKGSSTSATLPIDTEWQIAFKFYFLARYYERLTPDRITNTAMVNAIPTYLPASTMTNLVEFYYRKADEVAKKVGLLRPRLSIPTIIDGITD